MTTSSRSFVRSTAAMLLVGLGVLVAIVVMTNWLVDRTQLYFNQVIAARDARAAASELRYALMSAESSQRGFVITGNETYLAPYDQSKDTVGRKLAAVEQMFAAYPDRVASIDKIGDVIRDKVTEMDATIRLKREGSETEVLALVNSDRGQTLMNEAMTRLTDAISAADENLTDGTLRHRRNAAWLRAFTLAGGLLILVVMSAAAFAVYRYTRELRVARDAVDALNEGLEDRVRERTQQLAEANEEVQRFAYIVTHDLRAPLVNIMGFTSELETGVKSLQSFAEATSAGAPISDSMAQEARLAASDDLPEAIAFIRSSTRKMDGLINAILKLSRDGRRTMHADPIDLEASVRSAIAAVSHQLQQADASVDVDLKIKSLVGDAQAIDQILGNLIDNAVKYRAADRPLVIRVSSQSAERGAVRIRVEDNGRGIADHDRERVFELFRRSGTQDKPGEGIGLTYVRSLVRKLGGRIDLSSSFGEGTAFDIVLPRVTQNAEAKAA